MSLFNKWWDAANSKDRVQMAELLDDGFIFVRRGFNLPAQQAGYAVRIANLAS